MTAGAAVAGDGRRAWLLALLAGLSALLLALLAVATNLATNAVPARFSGVTTNPWWTWGATAVLAVFVMGVGVALQRLSSDDPGPRGSVSAAVVGPSQNLPPRNPVFVGRDSVFDRIEAELAGGPVAVVAVHGLGGMGKSAIALELAHRGHESGRYAIAWWIRAETESALIEDIANLAPTLGLNEFDNQEQAVRNVLAGLRAQGDWLVVFDNVPYPEKVRPWLPGGTGATLITSRLRGWGKLAAQVDLGKFSREESLTLLARSVDLSDRNAADELAALLGDMPLALAQAAGYMDLHHLPIASYLELYRDRDAAGHLLAEKVDGYPASVATTWLLHHDQFAVDEPAALHLLRLCAFLDPEDIDLDVLLSVPDLLPVELATAAGRLLDRERVIGALAQTSLASRIGGRRIRFHRLVAQVTRLQLGADERAWATRTAWLLNDLFPADPTDRVQWPRCAALSSHVSVVIEHAEGLGLSDPRASELFDRLNTYLQQQLQDDLIVYGTDVGELSPVRSAYAAQIRRIAPEALSGRERELAELAAFTTSDEEPSYLVLQAGPWSGKTALLSWFAMHPPPEVDVVAFFVTSRLAGQNDSSAFVENVTEQLAALLGAPLPVLSEATAVQHMLALLHDTAARARGLGRRLVLVVDGLDEDRSTGHSIAALLPSRVPPGLRIVVAGRLSPSLPADVPPDHPLRDPAVARPLAANASARVVRAEVSRDLRNMLTNTAVDQDVLGLITAARGGLTETDLAQLTGLPRERIEAVLKDRSFTRRSGSSGASYLFSH